MENDNDIFSAIIGSIFDAIFSGDSNDASDMSGALNAANTGGNPPIKKPADSTALKMEGV